LETGGNGGTNPNMSDRVFDFIRFVEFAEYAKLVP